MHDTKHFFIFGAPRSRTAWFANFLTTDSSHCFHELFAIIGTDKMVETLNAVDKPYVGESTPNGQLYPQYRKLYPEAPVVFVYRDVLVCFDSLVSRYGIDDEEMKNKIAQHIPTNHAFLEDIQDDKNAMIIDFNKLTNDVLVRAYEFCLLGLKCDTQRLKLLQNLNIQSGLKIKPTIENKEKWIPQVHAFVEQQI